MKVRTKPVKQRQGALLTSAPLVKISNYDEKMVIYASNMTRTTKKEKVTMRRKREGYDGYGRTRLGRRVKFLKVRE